MSYLVYQLSPLEHALSAERPRMYIRHGYAFWISNARIDQHSIKSRQGYLAERNLYAGLANDIILNIACFENSSGSKYTIYLTSQDACLKRTGTGETFSYITETDSYNGAITNINGATVTVSPNVIPANKVAAGDIFILSNEDTENTEPAYNWTTVSDVASSGGYITSIILDKPYPGTCGTFSPAQNCKIRHPYNLTLLNVSGDLFPSQRWQWAVVNDIFCFTSGDTNVKKWTGSGYVTDLDPVNATKAKYAVEYANRLLLANLYINGTPRPNTMKYSKEGDPTNWTDITAGEIDLLDSEEQITGLAKVGPYLMVFKPESYSIWYRTGVAESPIARASYRMGVGCIAPYSIAQYMGTVAWLGRNDFYTISGDVPESIGEEVRHLFLEVIPESTRIYTWSGVNQLTNEIYWVAYKKDFTQLIFVWNWKEKEWYIYEMTHKMTAFGRGLE